MTATLVIATLTAGFAQTGREGSAGQRSDVADERRATAAGADRCRAARKALRYYIAAERRWLKPMSDKPLAAFVIRGLACPRYLARVYRQKARNARKQYERWAYEHTLRDHAWWRRAVNEAQRAYPGTASWLMSCSASEGGWGRWVPNRQGSGASGWLQFMESTFWRMWRAAHADVVSRGFRVPRSAHSWHSPLGQALAGAWGVTNGRRHEWYGHGC